MARRRRTYQPVSPGRRCAVCGHAFPVCRNAYFADHEFISLTAERRRRNEQLEDAEARAERQAWIEEARARIQATKGDEQT